MQNINDKSDKVAAVGRDGLNLCIQNDVIILNVCGPARHFVNIRANGTLGKVDPLQNQSIKYVWWQISYEMYKIGPQINNFQSHPIKMMHLDLI